jgi:PAS domain S-box-containing protein
MDALNKKQEIHYSSNLSWPTWSILGVLLLAGLFLVGQYNFLLFHGLAELFSIVVAWSLFMLVWNTRHINENDALVSLGIAYFFVGLVDLLHTLAYKGMGVFNVQWGANLPTQLWILGRYMESVALMSFPILLGRRIHPLRGLAAWAGATAIGLSSIFIWRFFPDCYIEGAGLTPFKVTSEYIICLVLFVALALLHHHRHMIDATVYRLMAVSIFTTILAELAFTFYVSVYGMSNLIGHYLKIVSFTLIYFSLVRSGLTQPYSILFRSLSESEARYRNFISANLLGIWWYRIDPPMPTDMPIDEQVAWLDRHATIEESNDSYARMFGYNSAGEIIGMRLADLMGGNEEAAKIAIRKFAEEGGAFANAEIPAVLKTGKRVWFLNSAFSVVEDGKLVRILGSQIDITAQRRREKIKTVQLRLVEYAADHSTQKLLQKFLDEAEGLTRSSIGFIHFVDDDQKTLSLQTWSTNTLKHMCKAEGSGRHYPISQAGVWVDCIGERQPVIHNDYDKLPHKQGLPKGHAPVVRELVVPVIRGEKIVAILGVGNKANPYDQEDVLSVQSLAESMWETVVRRRAEEELKKAHNSLERQVEYRTKELAEALSELESLFNNSRVGMMVLRGGRILYKGNQRLADILGYVSPQAMEGLSMQALHLSETRFHEFGEAYYYPIQTGEVLQVEYELKRKDGTPVWCSLSGKALDTVDPPDLDKGVLWIVDDITERKRSEKVMLDLTRKLEIAHALGNSGWWEYDAIHDTVVWPKETYGIYGLEPDVVLDYDRLMQCIQPDYHDHHDRQLRKMYDEGEAEFQYQILRPDGEVRWVWARGETEYDDYGNAIRLFGTLQDITDRKRTEQALADSERRLSEIIEFLPDPTWVIDIEGRVIAWNKSLEQLTGIDKTAILGKGDYAHALPFYGETRPTLIDLVLKRDKKWETEYLKFEENEGQLIASESYHPLLGGDGRYLAATAARLFDSEGHVVGAIETVRDITHRKRAEEELKRSNLELEQFAYVASHDLQEPLRAIVGFLQLLEARYGDQIDAKGQHYIARSVNAGHRMQKLIRELLTLSRVNTRGDTFSKTDLNPLVEAVADNLMATTQDKKATITCDILPTLEIDASQIQSLFQNLILNAVKYNQHHAPTVKIGCRDDGPVYHFSIADNGIGISPKFHQRIFMVFQRLHTDREYSGTGLGLALCKKIVERHGGTIWVESAPDKGSTFYFTLPKRR